MGKDYYFDLQHIIARVKSCCIFLKALLITTERPDLFMYNWVFQCHPFR